MPRLHPNRRYLLDRAHEIGGRVLDYGAGAGELVLAARAEGVDMYGADTFPAGMGPYRRGAEATGIFGTYLVDMPGGRLPFPDDHFELCVTNQVFEHVFDLDTALSEISRVLRPGGTMISIFPSLGIMREGHIGIAFAHWLPPGSRAQYAYILAARALGFGRNRHDRDRLAWVRLSADRFTSSIVYRTRRNLIRSFAPYFDWAHEEPRYIRFRMGAHPKLCRLAWVADTPVLRSLGVFALRSAMGMVVVNRNRKQAPTRPVARQPSQPMPSVDA